MNKHHSSLPKRRYAFCLFLLVLVSLPALILMDGDTAEELEALFNGPEQLADLSTPVYLEPPTYDLSAYEDYDHMANFVSQGRDPFAEETAADEPDWIDGMGRELLQASMEQAQRSGAVERTRAVNYLLSPSIYREVVPSSKLHITYPPDGAVFPPNLVPPRVEWEDPLNNIWQITVGIEGAKIWTSIASERTWWFTESLWDTLRSRAVDREAWIQIKGVHRSGASESPVQISQKIHFRISQWPADNVIVYRIVVPPFNLRKTPSTYARDIRSFEVRPFLRARNHYCYNCHTFSAKSGTSGKLGIQVRYMSSGAELPVYLGIYDIEQQEGWRAKLPFDIQMSTFMSFSSNHRFLALSANQLLVTFAPIVYETQAAGQPTSDLAIYDVEESTSYLLPGASDPERLEILPRWDQDGHRIVYCSAAVGQHPVETQYDLYAIPFNDGKGGIARPVPGASNNERSNFFPRFSPNGRWMSFCQADAGILMKSSSDIFLLPSDFQGEPRRLESNVAFAADSWHSWSSNSRWLVFASKRDDGIFAQLYMTQIDDGGHASPPVRLPVKKAPLASFNIPEFVADWPRIEESELFDAVRIEAPYRSIGDKVNALQ